jgi:hypothetical protein
MVSFIVVLSHVGLPSSIFGKLELDSADEESVDQSWHIFSATASALAPINSIERPTLAESFSTPECIGAWIATGTLCSRIRGGEIKQDIRRALKLSIIHTWVNGSDQKLLAWKEAVVKGQRPPTTAKIMVPGNAARHFRCLVFR